MEALTPEQRAYAEAHHGLLIAFMEKHQLDPDYYGDLAQRYLKTVVRYLSEEKLQQYSFSTVVWYNLRSELTNIIRKFEREISVLHLDAIADAHTHDEAPFDSALWKQIEEILTYKQFEVILLRNQGYTNQEIASLCGISRKAVEKRFARVRKLLSNFMEDYRS